MSITLIQERLASQKFISKQEEHFALRQIVQEIALCSLARSNFFKVAAFQGGTCLRILYTLERYSEDLDFVSRKPEPGFSWKTYFQNLKEEFSIYGMNIAVTEKSKTSEAVRKAFLKEESVGYLLSFGHIKEWKTERKINIKIEIDTNPPKGSAFEVKYHDFPQDFSVVVQDLPSLFAGKLHALLCRSYTKGRDWYDFLWYVARSAKVNYEFLASAIYQQGPLRGEKLKIDKDWLITNLDQAIEKADWKALADDIRRFLPTKNQQNIELWNQSFYKDRLKKLDGYL